MRTWLVLFGVLFVGFGLIGAAGGTEQWQKGWGGLSAVALGCCVLLIACESIQAGTIRLHANVINQAHRPVLFKFTIALIVAAALGAIAAGIGLAVQAL